MDFTQFVSWVFYGVVGTCAIYIAKSINELNIQVAVLIEKHDHTTDEIADIKSRIKDLEKR